MGLRQTHDEKNPVDALVAAVNDGFSAAHAERKGAAGTGTGAGGVETLADVERRAILAAVAQFGGNKLAAAEALGLGKTTLYRKLKEYGYSGRLA